MMKLFMVYISVFLLVRRVAMRANKAFEGEARIKWIFVLPRKVSKFFLNFLRDKTLKRTFHETLLPEFMVLINLG